jgi:hypothetical protein
MFVTARRSLPYCRLISVDPCGSLFWTGSRSRFLLARLELVSTRPGLDETGIKALAESDWATCKLDPVQKKVDALRLLSSLAVSWSCPVSPFGRCQVWVVCAEKHNNEVFPSPSLPPYCGYHHVSLQGFPETIQKHRMRNKKLQWLMKWQNCEHTSNSWEWATLYEQDPGTHQLTGTIYASHTLILQRSILC